MLEFLPQPIRQIARGTIKLLVLTGVIIYVLFLPVDLIPEAFLGPIGLIDDFFVLLFGASFLGFDLFKGLKQKRITYSGGKNE